MNPLATPAQLDAESLALRLVEKSIVRVARERVRVRLLGHRFAGGEGGLVALDRALDQWLMELAMREANNDFHRPHFVWSADNEPRHWFGRLYPGGAVAIDNPDNINREAHIDGAGAYEVTGRFSDMRAASFSIMAETNVEHQAVLGRNLGTLTYKELSVDLDGSFKVTIDSRAADGRINHIQTEPGRVAVYTRDSLSDWRQSPASIVIKRVDGAVAPAPRGEEEIAERVAAHFAGYAEYWLNFAANFLNSPEPNTMVGPNGRDGGWGYLAAGRFALKDDEALVITTTDGGGGYTGAQVADLWTMTPDPVRHTASINKSQAAPNPDGSITYVVAPLDPGYANWLDTCGLHAGWYLLRWQAMPDGARATDLVRRVDFVKAKDIGSVAPVGAPIANLDQRRAAIAARVSGRAWRIREQ